MAELDGLYRLLLAEDYAPPVNLVKQLTPAQAIRQLIARLRADPLYGMPPPCGTVTRPHLFHPSEFDRLVPPELEVAAWDDPTGYGWTCCANCGRIFALYPVGQ